MTARWFSVKNKIAQHIDINFLVLIDDQKNSTSLLYHVTNNENLYILFEDPISINLEYEEVFTPTIKKIEDVLTLIPKECKMPDNIKNMFLQKYSD